LPSIDSREISTWFSGSKIVESGKPKILYHGGEIWENIDKGVAGAFWATDDPFVADTYAERYPLERSEIKPVLLKIKNPLDLRDIQIAEDFFGYDISKGEFSSAARNMAHNIPKENKEMIEKAKREGFDGIIHYDTDQYNKGAHTSYIAFSPEQVRFVSDIDFGETNTRFKK